MIIYKFARIVGLPPWFWEQPPSWSVSDRGLRDSLTTIDVLSLLVHRYVGLRRNEIADELAGNGAEKTSASLEPITKVTHRHVKTGKNNYRECFLGAFSQTERFRGGPQAFQDGTSRRARRLLNLGRNKVKWVMHLVTGHSTLKKRLYNLIGAMDKQKNCKTVVVVVVCREYDKKTRHTYRHLYQLPRYISFL